MGHAKIRRLDMPQARLKSDSLFGIELAVGSGYKGR
jgi:hypothetical protein